MTQKIITFLVSAVMIGSIATPALATTQTSHVTNPNLNTACIGTAVTARETAISAAYTTYSKAIADAYKARGTALTSAWSLTNWQEINNAVKAAWKAFKTSSKTATKNWQTGRRTAWTQFNKDLQGCHASSSVQNSESVNDEPVGQ